jgi:hypothetical protein
MSVNVQVKAQPLKPVEVLMVVVLVILSVLIIAAAAVAPIFESERIVYMLE